MGSTSQIERQLRFIPYRKQDVVEMLLSDQRLDKNQREDFRTLAELLQGIYHFEYHSKLERLKNSYAPLNPDRDTRILPDLEENATSDLSEQLELILNKANYELLTREQLERAFTQSSLFKLRLHVDFEDFSEVLVFTRGEHIRQEEVSSWFGLRRKTVEFVNFDRVVLYLQYRAQGGPDGVAAPAGSVILKLFQNVPRADMEMLFPNTRLGMRTVDKLVIGVPAVAGGVAMFTTKAGASLLLLGALLGYWLGLRSEPVQLNQATMLALLAGVGALGSFLWKQFSNFKNRKISFMKSLTENLYFKSLDNNAGVFHRLVDDAEEEECKEALIAYYFLLTRAAINGSRQLDQQVEHWFQQQWDCRLDFEVGDALAKLVELELIDRRDTLQAVSLEHSIGILRQRWDSYF
jgi:hypothetical protein